MTTATQTETIYISRQPKESISAAIARTYAGKFTVACETNKHYWIGNTNDSRSANGGYFFVRNADEKGFELEADPLG